MFVKSDNSVSTNQQVLVCDIKTKITLKYLSLQNLRIGTVHLVWRTVKSSVTDVKRAVVKARI